MAFRNWPILSSMPKSSRRNQLSGISSRSRTKLSTPVITSRKTLMPSWIQQRTRYLTSLSLLEMRAKARRLKAEHGLDLLILDYLQLMSGGKARFESRQQEISSISRGVKGLAKELDIPVLALSQLSRAPETRTGDHRPQL